MVCFPVVQTPAVVIGRVVEGMPVVKRMEVCGTRSGKPTKKVVIADCGQVRAELAGASCVADLLYPTIAGMQYGCLCRTSGLPKDIFNQLCCMLPWTG
jgi:hypothetical protein